MITTGKPIGRDWKSRVAFVKVVTESIGTNKSETIGSAAKLLCVSNGQSTQTIFAEEIEFLELDSTVEDRDGRLFVMA